MKHCISCGKSIDEAEANRYREARAEGLLCAECAAKFTAGIFKSSKDTKSMPPEINNPNIVAWDPKRKVGKQQPSQSDWSD